MDELTSESLTEFKSISQPSLSEDGSKVAFLVKKANQENSGYDSNIWVYEFDQDAYYRLTASDEDGTFVWCGSDEILFTSSRALDDAEAEESTEFYSISVTGGEATKEFRVPHSVESFCWSNEKLIYKATVGIEEEESEKGGPDCLTLDEIPFWANGEGFTNKKRAHLFHYTEETDEPKELTPGAISVGEFAVTGDKLAFVGSEYEDKAPVTNEIYLLLLGGDSSPERLTNEALQLDLLEFRTPDSLFVTLTDMEEAGLNQNYELFEFDLEEEEFSSLNSSWNNSFSNRVLTDVRLGSGQRSTTDGGKFYFTSTVGRNSFLTAADSEGGIKKVTRESGSVDDFDVENGRTVFVKLASDELQELYTLSPDGEEKRLTTLNEGTLPEDDFSRPERFQVER